MSSAGLIALSIQRLQVPHLTILHQCRLQRFAQMKKQLDSLDRDTIRQVDSACKEIARNCELLTIVKQDLDTIYKTTR